MNIHAASLLLLLIALIGFSSCVHIGCPHDTQDLTLDIDEDDKDDPFEGRMLQSNYENIRIYVDYSLLDSDLEPEVQAYIKEQLMPPVINYYQQLLKVLPRAKKLTYKKDLICGLPTPQIFKEDGVDADIAILVDASFEADSNYIAYARACTIQNGDNRPTFGNAHFNLKYVKVGGAKTHNENLLVALHELAHVFGISKGLFEFYYDPVNQATRSGHVISRELNGYTAYFVDVEPLTSKLKEFFSCPTLEGALLENEGESMSASHLERRVFYSEIMTAGEMEEARISEFMLAFLEGTGWYKGDYSMTEPVYWGKGKGCDFYYSPCIDRKTFNPSYEEFCPSLTEVGCSVTRKLGASCGATRSETDDGLDSAFNYWGNYSIVKDIFADNCPYFVPTSNKDCEDPNSKKIAFLNEEVYGVGSKCFSGTVSHPWQKLNKRTNYCFKSSCELQKTGKYYLKVQIGDSTVTCKSSGPASVSGYEGQIDCPDPSEYCTTYGKAFCERGCMGKGTCMSGSVCMCDSGWGGNSCGMKTYEHECDRCRGQGDKTSCFGDGCVCDPTADPSCPDLELKVVDDLISDDSEGDGGITDDSSYGNDGGRKNTGGAILKVASLVLGALACVYLY